jgi:hypothetical protein
MTETDNANGWVLAEKIAPIRAKKLLEPFRVETLEGILSFNEGDYLCKGPSNEIWGQTEGALLRKYEPAPEKSIKDGWRIYRPIPGKCLVLARSMKRSFTVKSRHGLLNGKPGDFLVRPIEGMGRGQKEWIVRADIFKETYRLL